MLRVETSYFGPLSNEPERIFFFDRVLLKLAKVQFDRALFAAYQNGAFLTSRTADVACLEAVRALKAVELPHEALDVV